MPLPNGKPLSSSSRKASAPHEMQVERPTMIRLFLYLIPLTIVGILAHLWQQEVALGKESPAWPTTTAIVQEAFYGGKTTRLSYSYTVAGTNYTGHRLEYCTTQDQDLRDYFAREISGKPEITISYRPQDPAQSVARPGMDARQYNGFLMLAVAAFIGFLLVESVIALFQRRR